MVAWLVKSEPGVWSWDDQVKVGVTHWDGVRNAQALGNMRKMRKGERAFFYHSGGERRIVGLVEVARTFYPDPKDAKSGLVDVKAVEALPRPITLAQVKADKRLAHLALVRQPRLSVMPIDKDAAAILGSMAGL